MKEVSYKSVGNAKVKTVRVPDTVTINGVTYKVTGISNNAFEGNKNVTTIAIGSNVRKISKNAFSGCTKLKTITIGKNVTTLGRQ